jgi:hypothetical protein
MKRNIAIIILIILFIIIYFVVLRSMNKINKETEHFTAISGMEQPLTTYDDYGTFNFLLQIDDFPYYDDTYEDMGCEFSNYNPIGQAKKCGSRNGWQSRDENFNKDSFIKYDGCHKVRRELVPSNYEKNNIYADADFDRNQLHLLIKKDRTRASEHPPQPYNIYFNKIPRD